MRLLSDDMDVVCEDSARHFTKSLGFSYKELTKGSFSDHHEHHDNQQDRVTRFLPKYFEFFDKSPSMLKAPVTDELMPIDDVDDVHLRITLTKVTGDDGMERMVDLGGVLPPGNEPVYLLVSHDESCFKSGEHETRGWIKDGSQTCLDKSKGSSLHFADFSCEWGNGTVSWTKEPTLGEHTRAPFPITIHHLRRWHRKWEQGVPDDGNPLPPTAAVWMKPGTNNDGWWCAEEFWMQMDLAMCIFERVFGKASRYKLVACLDWSSNHAAKPLDGLDATDMNVKPGGEQRHQRPTTSPPIYRPPMKGGNGLPTLVRRSYTCTPGCSDCLRHLKIAKDSNQCLLNYQAVGRKGLKQILMERGVWRAANMGQPELVAALQEFPDFSTKSDMDRARVTEQMAARGHVALFGVKYHAELAPIERKWMHLKRRIRPNLNGKIGHLEVLLRKEWHRFTVHDARKAARHCRNTMRAYQVLGDSVSLDMLQEEQKRQKGHRKVVDAGDGLLKAKADIALTEKEKKNAVVLETRREMSSIRADRDKTNAEEKESEIRRRLKLKHKRKAAELGTDNIEGAEPEPGEPEAEAQAAAE